MRVKTLIVGGGVMGVSIAFELARRAGEAAGESVLLVERRHLRLAFDEPVATPMEARKRLVDMARDA